MLRITFRFERKYRFQFLGDNSKSSKRKVVLSNYFLTLQFVQRFYIYKVACFVVKMFIPQTKQQNKTQINLELERLAISNLTAQIFKYRKIGIIELPKFYKLLRIAETLESLDLRLKRSYQSYDNCRKILVGYSNLYNDIVMKVSFFLNDRQINVTSSFCDDCIGYLPTIHSFR